MKVAPDGVGVAWGALIAMGAPKTLTGVGVGEWAARTIGLNQGGSGDGLSAWAALELFIGRAAMAIARPHVTTTFRMG